MGLMQDEEIEFCMVCGEPNPPDKEICRMWRKKFCLWKKFYIF